MSGSTIQEQHQHSDLSLATKPPSLVSDLVKEKRIIRQPHPYSGTSNTFHTSLLESTRFQGQIEEKVAEQKEEISKDVDDTALLLLIEQLIDDIMEEIPPHCSPKLGDLTFQGDPYVITNAPKIFQQRLLMTSQSGETPKGPNQRKEPKDAEQDGN